MKKDIYLKNIACLQEHHPDLWEQVTATVSEPKSQVVFSKSGLPNIEVENEDGEKIFLHFEDDPQMEISFFLDYIPQESKAVVAMFGMGLGYAPLAILEQRPRISKLLIFEPDMDVFIRALECLDLRPLLSSSIVKIHVRNIPPMSQITGSLYKEILFHDIVTLRHLRCFRHHPSTYEAMHKEFDNLTSAYLINKNTLLRFGKLFFKNCFKSAQSFPHDHTLDGLAQKFKNTPAILVSGGPSLNKNIHHLHKCKEKAIIISVDSAFPALHKFGITPHFITTADSQEITVEKFGDLRTETGNSYLVSNPSACYHISKHLRSKGMLWAFPAHEIEAWLCEVAGGKMLTAGGGTVALLSLQLAMILGCSPIILIGQDLAFSDGQDHACEVFLSAKDHTAAILRNADNKILVKGLLGGMVPTRRNFQAYIKAFENMIKNCPGRFINATEGGAYIEGYEVLSLAKAIKEHCTKKRPISKSIESLLKSQPKISRKKILQDFQGQMEISIGLLKKTRKLEKSLNEINSLLSKELEKKKIFKDFTELPPHLRKKIASMKKLDSQIDVAPFWGLVAQITLKGMQNNYHRKTELDNIKSDPEQYGEWLLATVQRISEVNFVRETTIGIFLDEIQKCISFYETEQNILNSKKISAENLPELIKTLNFYIENEEIRIAQNIIQDTGIDKKEIPELFFIKGKIAAFQNDFPTMNSMFAKAEQHNSLYTHKKELFLKKIAEKYIFFAQEYENFDRGTENYLLVKGLQFSKSSTALNKCINDAIQKNIEQFLESKSEKDGHAFKVLIDFWEKAFNDGNIDNIIEKNTMGILQHGIGKKFALENKFEKAIFYYSTALEHIPDNTLLMCNISDVLFNIQDYDQALTFLRNAIEHDPESTYLIEKYGDILFNQKKINKALRYYETMFTHNPKHFFILKKIGDCFLELGHAKAATQAYKECKKMVEQK